MKPIPRLLLVLSLTVLLPGCALFGRGGGGGGGDRARLWNEAFQAMSADSFRVARASFQRVANEHPRTDEGHSARFWLGFLALEPRSGVDLPAARQHLSIYLAEDTTREQPSYEAPIAESLLRLVDELQKACGQRDPGLPCPVETRVVPRSGEPPSAPASGEASAEIARLRREVNERDATIRELREELQRIRNTLAPRRP